MVGHFHFIKTTQPFKIVLLINNKQVLFSSIMMTVRFMNDEWRRLWVCLVKIRFDVKGWIFTIRKYLMIQKYTDDSDHQVNLFYVYIVLHTFSLTLISSTRCYEMWQKSQQCSACCTKIKQFHKCESAVWWFLTQKCFSQCESSSCAVVGCHSAYLWCCKGLSVLNCKNKPLWADDVQSLMWVLCTALSL